MKILYFSKGETADFLCDTLFHGLRSLLGKDVVDVNKLWFMYNNGFENGIPWHTFYGLLDDINVDRSDILSKIKTRYFDFIFYGSIHRYRPYLPEVLDHYPESRIVFIDGEDDFDMLAYNHIEPQNVFPPEPLGYTTPRIGFYFKRELSVPSFPSRIPIQFSIPKVKVVTEMPEKIRLMAPMDPRDRDSYKFPTQAEYFKQYSESCFGYTMRKGGWDCARHVEILAAGAIPYFIGLEDCPIGTLTELPKEALFRARNLCISCEGRFSALSISSYRNLWNEIHNEFVGNLTTEAVAKRVLRIITKENQ